MSLRTLIAPLHGLAAVGVSPLVLAPVVQGTGLSWGTAAIAVAAFAMVYSRRVPTAAIVAMGAVAGAALYI